MNYVDEVETLGDIAHRLGLSAREAFMMIEMWGNAKYHKPRAKHAFKLFRQHSFRAFMRKCKFHPHSKGAWKPENIKEYEKRGFKKFTKEYLEIYGEKESENT